MEIHKRAIALTMGLRAAAFSRDRSSVLKRVATRWRVNGQVICLLKLAIMIGGFFCLSNQFRIVVIAGGRADRLQRQLHGGGVETAGCTVTGRYLFHD